MKTSYQREIAYSKSLFNAAIVRDIFALRVHSINLHSNFAHDIMTVLVWKIK